MSVRLGVGEGVEADVGVGVDVDVDVGEETAIRKLSDARPPPSSALRGGALWVVRCG